MSLFAALFDLADEKLAAWLRALRAAGDYRTIISQRVFFSSGCTLDEYRMDTNPNSIPIHSTTCIDRRSWGDASERASNAFSGRRGYFHYAPESLIDAWLFSSACEPSKISSLPPHRRTRLSTHRKKS
jgi:hypothetical protein